MFIKIENHIININEIRNVTLESIGYGKGTVTIIWKGCQNDVRFGSRPFSECQTIFDTLTDACVKNF